MEEFRKTSTTRSSQGRIPAYEDKQQRRLYAATEDTLEDASSLWYYGDLTALN